MHGNSNKKKDVSNSTRVASDWSWILLMPWSPSRQCKLHFLKNRKSHGVPGSTESVGRTAAMSWWYPDQFPVSCFFLSPPGPAYLHAYTEQRLHTNIGPHFVPRRQCEPKQTTTLGVPVAVITHSYDKKLLHVRQKWKVIHLLHGTESFLRS